MCFQLEALRAAYGNVFTMDWDERYFSYSFSREGNGWAIHEASVEWKQMHGTDFLCVEVVFATVTAPGSTKGVESLTEEGFFPPQKGPTWMSIIWWRLPKMGGLGKEESCERNQIWGNFVAHFPDFVAIVCYIYSVKEREWGVGMRMKEKQLEDLSECGRNVILGTSHISLGTIFLVVLVGIVKRCSSVLTQSGLACPRGGSVRKFPLCEKVWDRTTDSTFCSPHACRKAAENGLTYATFY